MSEPVAFVFKKDGSPEAYFDRWAGALLFREIIFGPDALLEFARGFESIDPHELEEFEGESTYVDFDEKLFMWTSEPDNVETPKAQATYLKLLTCAWPEYAIRHAIHGIDFASGTPIKDGSGGGAFEYRFDTVLSAGRASDPDEEGDEPSDDEDPYTFEDDDVRAWAVIVDKSKRLRHRFLDQISQDFSKPSTKLLKELSSLKSAEVPSERITAEGIVINIPAKELHVWGKADLKKQFPRFQKRWKDWSVIWLDDGYVGQCKVLGIEPTLMSDAEALGPIMPILLSNKRFDMGAFIGAVGGAVKKWAVRGMGCLYLVACIPILIWGLVSANWKPALLTMLGTLIAFVAVFKTVELLLKRRVHGSAIVKRGSSSKSLPQVAGPEAVAEREALMSQLLSKAGLPSLRQIKEHYPDPGEYEIHYQ